MRLSWSLVPTFALAVSACALSHELGAPGDAAPAARVDAAPSPCGAPAVATYDCAPTATGAPGCSGTPAPFAAYTSVPDPDAEFAEGCELTLALCHPYYPGSPASCRCAATSSGPAWACAL